MIVERHYDEDSLVAILDARILESDAHLASCAECAERLEDFRFVTEALRDAATWDQREVNAAPNSNTIATLRAFADTMAAEDAAAARWLEDLLAGERETWMAKLNAHPEWRTAGMLRALIGRMPSLLDSMPADAVECASLATSIADGLPDDPRTAQLRGAAWRERAYSLLYVGRYAEAEVAVMRAQEILRGAAIAEFDIARVGTVKALIDRSMERIPAAFEAVRATRETFAAFGDVTREASAGLAHAQLLFNTQRFEEALTLLTSLEERVRASNDADSHARVLANLGWVCSRLGRTSDALRYHRLAATLFADLGVHTEVVRENWNIAAILGSEGRLDEALAAYHDVRGEFSRLGMVMPAALAGLHIAEILLSREMYDEVNDICQAAMRAFDTAGVLYGANAMTALAYIHEASRNRKATPALARHVRQYLEELPRNASLLFAPPPF
jgi:tetratricopeptide (TPR) repeat protein